MTSGAAKRISHRALSARHQVNASVATVQTLLFRPVAVHPNLVVEIAVGGFVAQIGADQLFEVSALFAFGDRGGAVSVEQSR